MRLNRSLAAAAALLIGSAPVTANAAAPVPSSVATRHPALTHVVGRSVSFVVYNDLSNSTVYLGNPTFNTKPRVFARHAQALAVSGDLVEYLHAGSRLWRTLDGSGRHGIVPSAWRYLAPDGGLRITRASGLRVLQYAHLDGTTRSYPLPAGLPTRQVHYSVVATLDGIVLTVSAPGAVPKAELLDPSGSFRALRTTGLHRSAPLTCSSISGTVIGCTSRKTVVRLDAARGTKPQLTKLSVWPRRVAVTDGYTSWTTALGRHGGCPCALASIDAPGQAQSITGGLTSRALISGTGRFYYSKGRKPSTAGVYVTLFAGSTERKVAKADTQRPR